MVELPRARRRRAPARAASASSRPSSAPPTPSSPSTSPPARRIRSARCRRCCSGCCHGRRGQGRAAHGGASRVSCSRSPRPRRRAAPAARPVAVERRRRCRCRRDAQPGEDGVGVARGRATASSRSGADGDQGQPQGGEPPRRAPAALPRAADRVPGAGRPPQLRHDLLRERAHRLRLDREPARPPGRHPGRRAGGSRQEQLRQAIAPPGGRPASTSWARSSSSSARSRARSSRATCACRSRRRSTTCSPGRRGRSTSRRASARRRRTSSSASTPSMLLLEGARRVDEWSLIEKKIPSFDLIFAVDPAHIGESAPDALGRAAAARAAARRHARRPGGHRRVGAGRVRGRQGDLRPDHGRASPTASGTSAAAAPKVNDGRVEEHRNLGVAFYKAGMLDEAMREFRRVADLRPDRRQRPVLPRPHRRCGRAAGTRPPPAFKQAADGGRAPSRRRSTTWATPSSGWAGSTRPRPPTATPRARARDDARIMLGWSVVALKRGEHQVAQGRLARALELLGGKPAPAALVLGGDAGERGPQ